MDWRVCTFAHHVSKNGCELGDATVNKNETFVGLERRHVAESRREVCAVSDLNWTF
jgi:hypothetical protein